jgi:hypothetical protein
MRYNPDTDRALNIDEIAAQCRNAILNAKIFAYPKTSTSTEIAEQLYAEVLQFSRWEAA